MTAVVLRGDARRLPLPDGCADLIVTSPPYWSLRSYSDGGEHYDGQIGSEETPEEYLAALWRCTRDWIRVLKPGGSIFVNCGDKYATRYSSIRGGGRAGLNDDDDSRGRSGQNRTGAGEKSLLGLPWRYALGCMDDLGLILRAEIVWAKPNSLPESVVDRVRRAHEQVFHFTRLPRYFAAVDEIREPSSTAATDKRSDPARHAAMLGTSYHDHVGDAERGNRAPLKAFNPLGKLPGSVWSIPSAPLVVPAHLGVDHFAAYPPELCRRIILGWSPPGVCTACGEGRRPITDRDYSKPIPGNDTDGRRRNNGDATWSFAVRREARVTITGYACACPDDTAPTRPAVVVDPFGGTGTTALVASVFGRLGFSFDRSADYCRLARWRVRDPAERARALQVPKPPPVPDGQGSLFDDELSPHDLALARDYLARNPEKDAAS